MRFSSGIKGKTMEERLSIDKCRKLIENNEVYSNSQIERVRNTFYVLANIIADKIIAMKTVFIRHFQTISCKGFIIK